MIIVMNAYVSKVRWNRRRPGILVISCSDGRFQEQVDEFLEKHLEIIHYDRLYLPGGPGALASSGVELLRSSQLRIEFEFLIASHDLEEVIFVFHGPSLDGPPDAMCADYKRKFPRATQAEIHHQQELDARSIMQNWLVHKMTGRIHFYRCEVTGDNLIQFVSLTIESGFRIKRD